jgi:hypothetical protein
VERRELFVFKKRAGVFFGLGNEEPGTDVAVEFSIFVAVLKTLAKVLGGVSFFAHGEVVHFVAVEAEFDPLAKGWLGFLDGKDGWSLFHGVLSKESDGNIYA